MLVLKEFSILVFFDLEDIGC